MDLSFTPNNNKISYMNTAWYRKLHDKDGNILPLVKQNLKKMIVPEFHLGQCGFGYTSPGEYLQILANTLFLKEEILEGRVAYRWLCDEERNSPLLISYTGSIQDVS